MANKDFVVKNGLQVDTDTLVVNSAADKVGVNTTPGATHVAFTISSNDAVQMPVGTEAQRPSGSNGQFRYNDDAGEFEGYAAGAWGSIAGDGGGGGGPSIGANSIIRTNDRTIREIFTLWDKNYTGITIQTTGNTITYSNHGYANGEIVQFSYATTFPGGLATETDYYVIVTTTNTFKVSLTYAGTQIDLTSAGSGSNAVWKCINGSTVGPVELGTGATVTVANGCTWSIV